MIWRVLLAGMALGIALGIAGASTASAQGTCPPGVPPSVFCGERNIAHATAGTYVVDPDHAAVLARVSHIGYSYSVFRFDRVAATLGWDPLDPARSSLSASVRTESITSNVKDFASQLAGDQFLKAPQFPEVTFVSTAFRPTDASSGKVDGRLTLMGKTAPVTLDVTLVGAGKGFAGQPRLGIHATTWIKPQDFALPAMFVEPVEISIDVEFERKP